MNNPTRDLFILLLDDTLSQEDKCLRIDALFKPTAPESKQTSPADIPGINFATPIQYVAPVFKINDKLDRNCMLSPASLPLITNENLVLRKLIQHGANLHLPLSIVAFKIEDAEKTRTLLLDPEFHFDMYLEYLPTVTLGKQTDNHTPRSATSSTFAMMYVKWQIDKTVNNLKALREDKAEPQLHSVLETFHLAMKKDGPFTLNYIRSRITRVIQCNNGNEHWYLRDFITLLMPYFDLPGKRSPEFQQAFRDLIKTTEDYNPESQLAVIRIFDTLGDRDQFVCKYETSSENSPPAKKEQKDDEPQKNKSTTLNLVQTLQQNSSPYTGGLKVIDEADADQYEFVNASIASASFKPGTIK